MAAKFYALGKAKALGLTEITVFPKKEKKTCSFPLLQGNYSQTHGALRAQGIKWTKLTGVKEK